MLGISRRRGAGVRCRVCRAHGHHTRRLAASENHAVCRRKRPGLYGRLLQAHAFLLHQRPAGRSARRRLCRHLLFFRHHRIPEGDSAPSPRADVLVLDRAKPSRTNQRRRLFVHPTPIPYRGENALVRQSAVGWACRAVARCEAGMDTPHRHRRKMYDCVAACAVGTRHIGCYRIQTNQSKRTSALPMAADAHRRPTSAAQSYPPLETGISPSPIRHKLRAE